MTRQSSACWFRPSATVEEHYLLQNWMRAPRHGEHRSSPAPGATSRDQDGRPGVAVARMSIADMLEGQDAALVVGSNLRNEAPILAHRVRKAALAAPASALSMPSSTNTSSTVATQSRQHPRSRGLPRCRAAASSRPSVPAMVRKADDRIARVAAERDMRCSASLAHAGQQRASHEARADARRSRAE